MLRTKGTKKFLSKLSALWMTPFVYDDDENLVLGEETYDIYSIVGDTIEISQDEGNTEIKENEFVSTPVIENTTSGMWNFRATCLDMQDDILKVLYGASSAYDTSNNIVKGVSVFPDEFKEIYCLVRVRFRDGSPDIVLPKVLLNSKLMVKQMRSNFATGDIQGHAFPTEMCIFNATHTQCLEFDDGTYTKRTPMFFVPTTHDFGIEHHHKESYKNDNVVMEYTMSLCSDNNDQLYVIYEDGSTIIAS